MTLSAGNQLYKVNQNTPISVILDRLNTKVKILGDPTKLSFKDLSEALAPAESLVVYEVADNAYYTQEDFDGKPTAVITPKLKVVY